MEPSALIAEFSSLHERSVLWMHFGPSTGSSIDFHFSPHVRREQPLRNAKLSEDACQYRGEFGLFINCAWRFVLASGKVGFGSSDLCLTGDFELAQSIAKTIEGQRVCDVQVNCPRLDCRLIFASGDSLEVLCDRGISSYGDYGLFVPSGVYSVSLGAVDFEPSPSF